MSQSQPETSAEPVVNESRVATVNRAEETMNDNQKPEEETSSLVRGELRRERWPKKGERLRAAVSEECIPETVNEETETSEQSYSDGEQQEIKAITGAKSKVLRS